MAIADTITSMYENVGEVYDTLTNVEVNNGTNLFNINPNTGYNITFDNDLLGTTSALSSWGIANIYPKTRFEPRSGVEYYFSADIRVKSGTYGKPLNYLRMKNTDSYATWTEILNPTLTNEFKKVCFKNVFSADGQLEFLYLQVKEATDVVLEVKNIMVSTSSDTTYQPYTDNPTYKNIENIPKVIRKSYLNIMNNGYQDIWNSWDKVNGSGTSVSLNNTEEAPMSIEYKGNTLQNGTPTPESPQDIHVVSGDNSIEVVGKNLISISSNYEITGGPVVIDLDKPVKAGTYIISIDGFSTTGTTSGLIHFLDSNNTQIAFAFLDNTTKTKKITVNNSIAKIRLYSQNSAGASTGITSTYKNMMLSVNGGTYEPYQGSSYPISLGDIELCKIGTYQDKIDKSSGNNWFDKDSATTQVGYFNSTGDVASGGSSSVITSYIKILPNTDYTISGSRFERICTYDKDKNLVDRISFTPVEEKTFNSNACYIRFQSPTSYFNLNTVMLNEGTTALPYEPYGTGWYLKKNIGKVVLNGSESWQDRPNYNTWDRFVLQTTTIPIQTVKGYSQYFNVNFTPNDALGYIFENVGTQIGCNFSVKGTTTLAQFKEWLSTHNTTVYYVVATPTYTKIEGTLKEQLEAIKKSYEGQTNISQENNDMPFELGVVALKQEL